MSKISIHFERQRPVAHASVRHGPRAPLIERLKWKKQARTSVRREWPGILNPSNGD